jgi:hypothetical protein
MTDLQIGLVFLLAVVVLIGYVALVDRVRQ